MPYFLLKPKHTVCNRKGDDVILLIHNAPCGNHHMAQSTTPQQAAGYVTLAAFAKCLLRSRLAHCPRESKSGVGGIRTLVPRRANAFRVRPVMTTSIRLHIFSEILQDSLNISDFLIILCKKIQVNPFYLFLCIDGI